MKKKAAVISVAVIILAIIGIIAFHVCTAHETYQKKNVGDIIITSEGAEKRVVKAVEGNLKTYYEIEDGTWFCNGLTYKYRLEISGRMSNAACDSFFVYLSNLPDISFEQAWKASGLSSNIDDYFALKDAILVEMGAR